MLGGMDFDEDDDALWAAMYELDQEIEELGLPPTAELT